MLRMFPIPLQLLEPKLSAYEIGLLGDATSAERQTLTATLATMIESFELSLGKEVVIRDGASIQHRNKHAAFVCAYFGGSKQNDQSEARKLVRLSAPIIPTILPDQDFSAAIPDFLRTANGLARRDDDPHMTVLATALLECLGLLRRQRRVFLSYRRIEARAAATQLHDLLTARGFDVFLDTHSIRPGEPFQDVLWHRLCDSDAVVMLDTQNYFDSIWTRQELGRALAKEIHVLRVIWPDHKPSRLCELSETFYLRKAQVHGPDGPFADATAEKIVLAVEKLRCRSIAFRYLSMTGRLRAEVESIGGRVEGIGAHRAVSIRLPNNKLIWAYPVVGVPTAETLHDVAEKASDRVKGGVPVLVYDNVGIRDQWKAHLKWLGDQITSVRTLLVREAAWELAGWES